VSDQPYKIVLEQGETSWGADVLGLPGRIAVAETEIDVWPLIIEAIEFHLEDLNESSE
jgi:predicted RNase H-like HicB family nuclease